MAFAEPLEDRRLLSINPVISEFMAANSQTLDDEDGNSSDWIEIYNPSASTVNLAGYHLTDNPDNLGKWTFPAVNLAGTQHLLVFASEKDRTNPAAPLHTNFKLADDGGYLALVAPDGQTVLHEYGTRDEPRQMYPQQLLDVSFGVAINVTRQTLLTTSANVRVQVPQDDSLGETWTALGFDDSAWTAGYTGVGYEGTPPIIPATGFTARMVDVDGTVASIADAQAILNGTAPAGSFTVTNDISAIRATVNFGDGGDWPLPYALPDGNARGDQYALRITSNLIIPAGTWSLRIKSDQGFILTMPGVNFLTRSGEDYTGTPWNSATVPSDTTVYGVTRDDGSTTVTFTVPASGLATRLTLDTFDNVTADDSLELLIAPGTAPTRYYMVAHGNYGWALSTVGPGTLPYTNLIQTNVGAAMRNQNASALLRLPFSIEFPDDFDALNLRMRYDDGFVAFINGVRITGSNAPGLLEWNSTATAEHPSSLAVNFEDFTVPAAGLMAAGLNVLSIQGLNLSASDEDFFIYPQLEALKISVGGQRFFQKATPSAINDTSGLTQSVGDTTFSPDRGFYDAPFDLTLSATTSGATIRYTLDGSAPTASSGTIYTGPIHIERTTTIRAIAYASGFIPTNVDTHTYLFLSDVVNQSSANTAPPGWPASWGTNSVDYGMDPTVVAPSPAAAVLPNGKMVFTAFAPATGQEPYVTDGTAAGTFLLKDIYSGSASSGAGAFVSAGNYVYFRAAGGMADHELWRTDGTANGTVRVQDIRPSGIGSYPNGLLAVGSVVYFAADDGSSGYELWKSDSATNTTSRVKDINGGIGSSYPSSLTNVNGTLYFTANTSASGWELYKSDGTDAGTVLVKDIRSGSASSSPMRLTAVGSTLFFTADDGSTGSELWKSNGTSATTVRIADISPGINGSFPNELVNVGGTLYFAAYQPATGMELWKSDGTTATLVKDINPGPEGSSPKGLANFNGVLAFTADEPVNGRELWRSGGAAGSTLLVRDIRPGPKGSKPGNLTVLGSTLYFSADDGTNGVELWQTDGSIGNGGMVADIVAGDKGSGPACLTVANGSLIFTTDEDDENQRLRKWSAGTGLSTLSALAIEREAGFVQSDLLEIPTISIVMKLDDLFNASTGIYANPSKDGGDGAMWEKPMSMELINPDGSPGFQIDAGIRIRGGFSRSTGNPKHGFRLFFRSEYGDGKLNYPMFGPDGADSFDSFDLRTFQNYSWSFQGAGNNNGIFMRDQSSRDMQLALGQPAERGDYYHLYIDGVYWGIYNTAERPEASYGATYFGGREEDYDVIKPSPDDVDGAYTIDATDGNMEAWTSLWNQALGNMTVAANYQKILGNNPDGTRNPSYPVLLDVDNLIDYMLVVFFAGNRDAPLTAGGDRPNNFFAIRNRLNDDGFRFFAHDNEHTLLSATEDRTGPYANSGALATSNPQYLFQLLSANAEFKLRVADRMNKWFNNDGELTPAKSAARIAARQREIENAVYAESARWGDAKIEPARTRQQEWITELNRLYQSYFPTRTSTVFNQLKSDGYYPSVAAPTFSQFGGEITSGFRLAIGRPGTSGVIYFMTDGTDPRAVNGAVRGTAYTESFALTGAATVKARVLDNGVWSALTEASFTYDLGDLRITEIMYNPALPPNLPPGSTWTANDFEWLEVQNAGTGGIALGGAYFTDGIRFHFPATTLAPGAYGLIVANQAAFEWLHGAGLPILGEFEADDEGKRTQLSDGGEVLDLRSADGDKVIEFDYEDDWHPITDGAGFSLVAERPSDGRDEFDTSSAWRPSFRRGGTPAAADGGYATGSIIVSELLANSTAIDPGDWVEFRNTTGQDIDISGWFLSDSGSDLRKYAIPAGTVIPAGQYLVFTQAAHFGAAFVFDNIGESVRLTSSDNGLEGGFRISESFGASDPNISFGLYTKSTGNTDFVALQAPTLGLPNSAARIGPIVISEIMYNPAAGGDEYIELKNISASTVSMTSWQFTGVTLTLDASASLAAGKYGLVVGIDPAAFRSKYSIDATVPIWRWTAGTLDNGGEVIEISRPGPVSDDIPSWILVDRVKYQDGGDWPSQPDGNGPSLVRLPVTAYGNDAANWTYGPVGGTPGSDPAVRTGRTSTDTYTLRLDPTGLYLQFFENVPTSGAPTLAVPVGQYSTISIDLVSGSGDTLIIDLTYGNPVPSGGIFYNGGTTTGTGSGADVLRITGGSGSDWIMASAGRVLVGSSFVSFTGVEAVFIDGNDGNDTLGVSGPISYNPTITGGNGSDRLLATGSSGDDAIRLTASQLIFGAGAATFSGMETYQVDGTQGADTLTVPGSLAFNPTFNGGNGDDRLVIEGAMTVQPVFNGGDGFDSFAFAGTGGNDSFTIEPTRLLFGALSIGLNAINLVTIDGGEGADTLTITGPLATNVQFNAGGGADLLVIEGTAGADILTIDAGQALYGAFSIILNQAETFRFNGGAGDDHLIAASIVSPITYDGGTGNNRLTVAGTSLADQFVLAPGSVTSGPLSLSYTNVGQLQVDTLGGDDTITVPASLSISQAYNLGDGEDTLRILGSTTADTFTLAAGSILRNGVAIAFSGTESVGLDGDAGGDYFTLPIALPYSLRIDGNGGEDRVTVTGGAGADELTIEPDLLTGPGLSVVLLQAERLQLDGNGDNDRFTVRADVPWLITVNGGAGTDRLTILAAAAGSTLSITGFQITGMPQVMTYSSAEDLRILGAAGNDSVTLANILPYAPFISLGEGNDTLTINAGTWSFGPELTAGGDGLALALAGATVNLNASMNLRALSIATDARVNLAASGSRLLRANALAIAGTGVLDLADNDLIAGTDGSAAAIAAVEALFFAGRNSGAWNGAGITASSLAGQSLLTLAMMPNRNAAGQPLLSSFDGQDVDANCVLFKRTTHGDLDLNGRLDGDDYFLMDLGYLAGQSGWRGGDVNYSGGPSDGTDYFLTDLAYLRQTPAAPSTPFATAPIVPFAPVLAAPLLGTSPDSTDNDVFSDELVEVLG